MCSFNETELAMIDLANIDEALAQFTCEIHLKSPELIIEKGKMELIFCCPKFKSKVESVLLEEISKRREE